MRKLKSWFKPGPSPAEPGFTPSLPLDALGEAFIADPAPTWAYLRDHAPLAPLTSGGYVLTRAADIKAAFTDARLGNTPSRFSMLAPKNAGKYTAAAVAHNIPPFLDKPRHVEMRKPLSAAFFEAFEGAEGWLGDMAATHLSALPSGEALDLIAGFGRPFAASAMARFVGLPEDLEAISRATGALFKMFAPIVDRAGFGEVNTALDDTRAFIGAAVATRRGAPGDDLISALIARGGLSDTEFADHALLVLADGIENIEAAIGQMALLFDRHPEAADMVRDGGAEAVVTEALRLETPAQMIPRVVREAHVRDGVDLPEGTPLFLALGSANLDPDLHVSPQRFDPERDLSQVLMFGQGRHRCIGAPLGLALVVAGAGALAARGLSRVAETPVTYLPRMGHRWPTAVMVTLDP